LEKKLVFESNSVLVMLCMFNLSGDVSLAVQPLNHSIIKRLSRSVVTKWFSHTSIVKRRGRSVIIVMKRLCCSVIIYYKAAQPLCHYWISSGSATLSLFIIKRLSRSVIIKQLLSH
jgi:hypothetical protein